MARVTRVGILVSAWPMQDDEPQQMGDQVAFLVAAFAQLDDEQLVFPGFRTRHSMRRPVNRAALEAKIRRAYLGPSARDGGTWENVVMVLEREHDVMTDEQTLRLLPAVVQFDGDVRAEYPE